VADLIIINTGPLIALERAGALDLPASMAVRFVCPAQVQRELEEGHEAGYPRIEPGWLDVMELATEPSPAVEAALDQGEAAVIQLAIERRATGVCIDEWRGRRVARASGLTVLGSLALMGMAKRAGLIEAVAPLVERAVQAGIRYHPTLVQAVLEELGGTD